MRYLFTIVTGTLKNRYQSYFSQKMIIKLRCYFITKGSSKPGNTTENILDKIQVAGNIQRILLTCIIYFGIPEWVHIKVLIFKQITFYCMLCMRKAD